MAVPHIVSIQSQPVYGCAGNSAAVPLLHGLGATVYAVPTVVLSNTPHYPTLAVRDVDTEFFKELLARLLDRLPSTTLDGVLVGYVRRPDLIDAIARFIDRVRETHPGVTVLIDPVMGDVDLGAYVPEDACHRIRDELVPRADICTPNLFEAGVLTGRSDSAVHQTPADPDTLLAALSSLGPSTFLLSGIGLGTVAGQVTTQLWHDGDGWSITTPIIDIRPTGTGDLLSAAFLYHVLAGRSASEALQRAVAVIVGLMEIAAASGHIELEPARLPPSGPLPPIVRVP